MTRKHYSVDLIKQIAECDANYIRLLKLIPSLAVYRGRTAADAALDPSISVSPAQPVQTTVLKDNSVADLEAKLQGKKFTYIISDIVATGEKVRVEIEVLETFKYTTTLRISQKPELENWMTNPSMQVRIYHDACTAEVMSYQGHRNLEARYQQPNPGMYHADEKMQVNRFLGEWLSCCLKVGRSEFKTEGMALHASD